MKLFTQTTKKLFFLIVCCYWLMPVYAADSLMEVASANSLSFSQHNTNLVYKLQRQGVQVQMTSTLKLILSVDNLFQFPSHTQLRSGQEETLASTAELVRHYGNRLITVSGYTDDVGSDDFKLKRSRDQANTIAAYLWSQGIPLKNILVVGYGDTYAIASNHTSEGSAANRRIEIEIR